LGMAACDQRLSRDGSTFRAASGDARNDQSCSLSASTTGRISFRRSIRSDRRTHVETGGIIDGARKRTDAGLLFSCASRTDDRTLRSVSGIIRVANAGSLNKSMAIWAFIILLH